MLNDIKKDAQTRMAKSVEAFRHDLTKLRTGRATTALVDHLKVNYYGSDMPLIAGRHASTVADARSLTITPWEKQMVGRGREGDPRLRPRPDPEHRRHRDPHQPARRSPRSAARSCPSTCTPKARTPRSPIRNIRRDANQQVKELLKEKQITEDEVSRTEDDIQKLTDKSRSRTSTTWSRPRSRN